MYLPPLFEDNLGTVSGSFPSLLISLADIGRSNDLAVAENP